MAHIFRLFELQTRSHIQLKINLPNFLLKLVGCETSHSVAAPCNNRGTVSDSVDQHI